MTALARLLPALLRGQRLAFLRGAALAALVLLMGVSLLALSGWFITAAAAAGLAGVGVMFNVFVPSAMVRFLALGRAAARYGERLATHDATLHALAALRVRLIEGLLTRPWRQLERLRANAELNRVTADVDALDGLALRLVLPAAAGGLVIALSMLALWLLVHPLVALVAGLGTALPPTLIFLRGQHRARRPARQAEAALQAARARTVDLVSARDDLTVYGQLPAAQAHLSEALRRHADARDRLDRVERRHGLRLDLASGATLAAVLALGAELAGRGLITAPQAAIAVLATLALAETTAPIRRALTEIGRMAQAARRVGPAITAAPRSSAQATEAPALTRGPVLEVTGLQMSAAPGAPPLFAPIGFTLAPGETLALTGPSGSGKSTVLLAAAGVLAPAAGQVALGGVALSQWPEEALRARVVMVPQRAALIAGTVADNLRLAAPDAGDPALWTALEATALAATLRAKDGLQTRLGFRGAGLSGGEARRLVLARALLCRPQVLLLDEPTEGLDTATAARVLEGIRAALPEAAILLAAHRAAEVAAATRSLGLQPATPPCTP